MYIDDFYRAIEKRKANLNCLQIKFDKTDFVFDYIEINKISGNLKTFLVDFKPLSFEYNNRYFQLLDFSDWILFEDTYLFFSYIGDEKICFNVRELNSVSEWDIVSYNNKYLITRTISSYLTNKVWAWIDRGRKVWSEEF